MVLIDQVCSFREDNRLDDLIDRLGDDLANPVTMPALDQGKDRLADAVELLFAGPEVEVDKLAVERTQRG